MPASPATGHAVTYRVSTAIFGRRFYLAFFVGPESRGLSRLKRDGQPRRFAGVALEIIVVCLAISMMVCMLTGFAVIAAYVVKSAMGIDLFKGPSFLHDHFYWQ